MKGSGLGPLGLPELDWLQAPPVAAVLVSCRPSLGELALVSSWASSWEGSPQLSKGEERLPPTSAVSQEGREVLPDV